MPVHSVNKINHPDRKVEGAKWCVECSQARAWNNVKRAHNIGREEYMMMYKGQGGRCLACRKVKKPVGSTAGYGMESSRANNKELLVIDHCHTSGQIRGLLCSPCNMALGLLEDDSRRLSFLAEYVQRSK